MTVTTTTALELTAEQVQHLLVQPLLDSSVILSAGCRIFDTNGSPVRIPKLVSMSSPNWHGEAEVIDSADATVDEVKLRPETLKSVKSLTRFSNELARQSVVALDAALRDRMVFDVTKKIDTAFIAGDGTITGGIQTTPVGILNFSGTQQIASVGTISLDNLHDAEGLALGANVNPDTLRWILRPETLIRLRKLKATTGEYLIEPDPTAAGRYMLLGHPVTVTKRIPTAGSGTLTTSAILWDPSQTAIARDLSPSVKVLDQTFGDSDEMALRVVTRYDIGALNPEGTVILRAITL